MGNKVYCSECVYIKKGFSEYQCHAPENLSDHWFKKSSVCDVDPRALNRFNNCYFYVPKKNEKKYTEKFWYKVWRYLSE